MDELAAEMEQERADAVAELKAEIAAINPWTDGGLQYCFFCGSTKYGEHNSDCLWVRAGGKEDNG